MKLDSVRQALARYPFVVKQANRLRHRWDEFPHNPAYRPRFKRIALDSPHQSAGAQDLSVVLLVVDSLRADALSGNGYIRETTPFLDTFDCRLTAVSASYWTYPSVPSILTGLYPHNHGAFLAGEIKDVRRPETYLRMREDVLTLPEVLRFLGYRIYYATAIAPGGDWYSYRPGALPRVYSPATTAEEMLGDLERWIDQKRKQRFFAYVHLADLHPPMRLPDSFRHFFSVVKDLPNIDTWDFRTDAQRQANRAAFEEYRQQRRLLYDNALRYVDSAVEAFYHTLMRLGLAHSTLLIVTADHGEQFWEHADLDAKHFQLVREVSGVSHGDSVYSETIQVPLLFDGPVSNQKPGCLTSTTDIVPTILQLLGISHKWHFDGQDVFASTEQRALLSEASARGHERKSLTIGRYRLLYSKEDGIGWLFDLERDPKEQHPITDKAVTSIFVKRLLTMLERDERRRVLEAVRRTHKGMHGALSK